MRSFLHWLLTYCEINYQTAYWESVAHNEAWLKLLMELSERDK